MRHLQRWQAVGAVRRGAEIEQFLDRVVGGGEASIRWLSAGLTDGRLTLRMHHVLDIGTSDFRDISEFPPLDPDEYVGEGQVVADEASAEVLLDRARDSFGATDDRWVNQGLVGSEYEDALALDP